MSDVKLHSDLFNTLISKTIKNFENIFLDIPNINFSSLKDIIIPKKKYIY